jgi:hypothetical protein
MTPEVFMMAALVSMWVALVVLTWVVWRLHRRLADHETPPNLLTVADFDGGDEAWAAVTEAFRDTHSDLEVSPR